jgi:YrbI family 3-deoxy-D-manno-octulosonate 8-phosphate phosphatase
MTIKFVVFDFDGVFTNGTVYFNNSGEIIKTYNAKDGLGINLLKKNNIKVGVISGYKNNNSQIKILEHLKIEYISLGSDDKLKILQSWCNELNININTEVAYMGDDVNDIDIMNFVKIRGCPKNAHESCLKLSNFVSKKNGGDGCVREFCDYIINQKKKIFSFENFESGMFSDLFDKWNIKNKVLLNFKLNNTKLKYFGRIKTILTKNKEDIKDYKDENIKTGLQFIDTLTDEDVLFVDGSNKYAYFGQLMTRLCNRQKIKGVVINGLTRDSCYTFNSCLPIHSLGYSPIDIKERGAVVSTNKKFIVNNIEIVPNDYIFGDNDGIVIIPKNIYENEYFQNDIKKVLLEEKKIKNYISSGESINTILKTFKEF